MRFFFPVDFSREELTLSVDSINDERRNQETPYLIDVSLSSREMSSRSVTIISIRVRTQIVVGKNGQRYSTVIDINRPHRWQRICSNPSCSPPPLLLTSI